MILIRHGKVQDRKFSNSFYPFFPFILFCILSPGLGNSLTIKKIGNEMFFIQTEPWTEAQKVSCQKIAFTANIFEVIFTVFSCVRLSTVVSLYGLHLIAAPSTIK